MGDSPAAEVVEVMHAVMHLLRSRLIVGLQHQGHDLTPMEGKVLSFFARRPGTTQSDLAAYSGRDKGQLAKLIGGLRERGLLDAQVDAQDRRIFRLQLTPAALQLHQAVKRQRHQLAELAVSDLSPEERDTLRGLLGRVLTALDKGN